MISFNINKSAGSRSNKGYGSKANSAKVCSRVKVRYITVANETTLNSNNTINTILCLYSAIATQCSMALFNTIIPNLQKCI